VIGHLGSRVSALLDGHLDPAETERVWAHVHDCHACRDLVEREGWVKRRLARLGGSAGSAGGAPDHLKGSLLGGPEIGAPSALAHPWEELGWPAPARRSRRGLVGAGVAAVGGGAVGAAVVGVLALGASPASAPTMDQRTPVSQLSPSIAVPGVPAPGGLAPTSDRARPARP